MVYKTLSEEFAMVKLGQASTVRIEDIIGEFSSHLFSFKVDSMSTEMFISPVADVVIENYPAYPKEDLWLYAFNTSRENKDSVSPIELAKTIAQRESLEFINPFDRNWRLFQKATWIDSRDDIFLLKDIIITRNTITSRGTYAGDEDDTCYNDDFNIVAGDRIKTESYREFSERVRRDCEARGETYNGGSPLAIIDDANLKIKLYPQNGPMGEYFRDFRGQNEVENGENERAKLLAKSRRQVWFKVELSK